MWKTDDGGQKRCLRLSAALSWARGTLRDGVTLNADVHHAPSGSLPIVRRREIRVILVSMTSIRIVGPQNDIVLISSAKPIARSSIELGALQVER